MNISCQCQNTYLNKRVLSIIDKVNKGFDVNTYTTTRGPHFSDEKYPYCNFQNAVDLYFIGVLCISIETGGQDFCQSTHRSDGQLIDKHHDTEESLEQLLTKLFSEAQRLQVKC